MRRTVAYGPPDGNAGQRPTAPMGGRFTPTRGRALPYALCFLLSATGTFLSSGTAHAGEPALDPTALTRLVHQDCGSCHGLTLKGGLGPDIRPETIDHYDPEVLQSVILDGIPDTAMPPWRPLITEAEAAWIADYLLKGDTE